MTNQTKKKRKGLQIFLMAIMIFFIFSVTVVAGGVVVKVVKTSIDKETPTAQMDDARYMEVDDVDKAVEDDPNTDEYEGAVLGMAINSTIEVAADTQEAKMAIKNNKSNGCTESVTLYVEIDGVDTIVYDSGKIPSGKGIFKDKLSVKLKAGKYTGKALFKGYSSDGSVFLSSSVAVTVKVR